MRLNIRRHALIAFLLALGCGVGLWYALVHRDATGWLRSFRSGRASLSKFFPGYDAEPQVRFVPCPIVERFATGLSNVKKVTLREGPGDDTPILAEMEMRYPVGILGATRDFIHVRYPDREARSWIKEEGDAPISEREGWARWAEIIPVQSAVVLDAETGDIRSRFLLPRGTSEVAFSPDGRRAIFYGYGAARELLTSDYSTARCLHVAPSFYIDTIFYNPDGALYAAVFEANESGSYDYRNRKMSVVRVSETGEPSQLTGISSVAAEFRLTGDGRTGFILRRTEDSRNEVEQVEVVDLQSLKIRNSFKVNCDNCLQDFTINHSGSELYLKPYYSDSIHVIDTRTGKLVRVLPYRTGEWMPFAAKVIGDSLYFEDSAAPYPRPMVLLNSDGMTKVDPLIATAIETGGARFNLNLERTRLLRLDAEGKIQESFWIERPEVRLNPEAGDYVFAGGLTATPDSGRLLLFISYSDEARAIMECAPARPHSGKMKH